MTRATPEQTDWSYSISFIHHEIPDPDKIKKTMVFWVPINRLDGNYMLYRPAKWTRIALWWKSEYQVEAMYLALASSYKPSVRRGLRYVMHDELCSEHTQLYFGISTEVTHEIQEQCFRCHVARLAWEEAMLKLLHHHQDQIDYALAVHEKHPLASLTFL